MYGLTTASPRPQGRAARILQETLRSPNANEGNTRGRTHIGSGKYVRLTEVLLLQASAELGPSGRRGPWLLTLEPSGRRRWRGGLEGLKEVV